MPRVSADETVASLRRAEKILPCSLGQLRLVIFNLCVGPPVQRLLPLRVRDYIHARVDSQAVLFCPRVVLAFGTELSDGGIVPRCLVRFQLVDLGSFIIILIASKFSTSLNVVSHHKVRKRIVLRYSCAVIL